MKKFPDELRDWWPCACVKGGGRGKPSTHIKLNAPGVEKCRRCGATKANADHSTREPQKGSK